jgi:ABC-type uncharacterized transport system involved in gliding motility auxiliary subunit
MTTSNEVSMRSTGIREVSRSSASGYLILAIAFLLIASGIAGLIGVVRCRVTVF